MSLAASLVAPLAAALLSQAPAVVDRVAATVNGDVITLGELIERSGRTTARSRP